MGASSTHSRAAAVAPPVFRAFCQELTLLTLLPIMDAYSPGARRIFPVLVTVVLH